MLSERNQEQDEQWIRGVCTKYLPQETVYVRHEYYDGGYEVRVGTYTFFLEYGILDENEEAWVKKLLLKGGFQFS